MSTPVKRNTRRLLLLTGLAMVMLLVGTASAAGWADVVPGGPDPTTNPPTAGIMTYADIVKSLKQIELSSQGAVDVYTLTENLGSAYEETKSEAGRDLYVAQVGHGPIRVWVSANIHGSEQLTSEAVLEVVKKLAAGGSGSIKTLLESLTIYAIPCMNPDGRELMIGSTILYDDATGQPLPGPVQVNLNRDWFVGMSGRPPLVLGMRADETKAWFAFFSKIQPHYLLDLHHQGFKTVAGTNESTSMSLGISLSPDRFTIPGESDPLYGDRTFKDMVRQLQGYVYDNITGYGYTHIDRYQLSNFTGPGRTGELNFKGGMSSAVMLGKHWMNYLGWNDADWKCPAIFFETKGSTSSLGQKANGYLTKQNAQGITALLTGIATGDAWDVSPNHWYDIPAVAPIWGYYTDNGDWPVGTPSPPLDPPLPY